MPIFQCPDGGVYRASKSKALCGWRLWRDLHFADAHCPNLVDRVWKVSTFWFLLPSAFHFLLIRLLWFLIIQMFCQHCHRSSYLRWIIFENSIVNDPPLMLPRPEVFCLWKVLLNTSLKMVQSWFLSMRNVLTLFVKLSIEFVWSSDNSMIWWYDTIR